MIHDVPASLGSLAGKHPPSLDLLSLQPSRVIINSFIIEFLFPLLSLGITVLAVASIRYIGLRLHAVGCKYLCLLKLRTHFWKRENFLSDRPFIFQKKIVYVQKEICPFMQRTC